MALLPLSVSPVPPTSERHCQQIGACAHGRSDSGSNCNVVRAAQKHGVDSTGQITSSAGAQRASVGLLAAVLAFVAPDASCGDGKIPVRAFLSAK